MKPAPPRLHRFTPVLERLLAVVMVLLLIAFAVLLLVEPSAVGRGGR